jgi:molecular chaperone GrpE
VKVAAMAAEAQVDQPAEGRASPAAAGEESGTPQPEGEAQQAPKAADDAARAEEYLQALQRLKADFDNYRKRQAQEQARWGDAAVAAFVLQLLPVVDNLERALAAAGDAQAVRQGVELTVRQLREVLAQAGITPMTSVGEPFDPTRHEAVARGPAPGVPEGVVAEEYRRGYLFRDQVLRPALVRVSDGSAGGDGVQAAPGSGTAEATAGDGPRSP